MYTTQPVDFVALKEVDGYFINFASCRSSFHMPIRAMGSVCSGFSAHRPVYPVGEEFVALCDHPESNDRNENCIGITGTASRGQAEIGFEARFFSCLCPRDGFSHWRGEDCPGMVLLTDGRRMPFVRMRLRRSLREGGPADHVRQTPDFRCSDFAGNPASMRGNCRGGVCLPIGESGARFHAWNRDWRKFAASQDSECLVVPQGRDSRHRRIRTPRAVDRSRRSTYSDRIRGRSALRPGEPAGFQSPGRSIDDRLVQI